MRRYAFDGQAITVENGETFAAVSEFEDSEYFAEFEEEFSIGFEKASPKGYTCEKDVSPLPWYAPWGYWDYDEFLPTDGVFRTAEELGEMHAKNYYDELERILAEEQEEEDADFYQAVNCGSIEPTFFYKDEALAYMAVRYGDPVENSCGDLLDCNVKRDGKTFDVCIFRTYRRNGGVLKGAEREEALRDYPGENPTEEELYDYYNQSSNDAPMLLLWEEVKS